MLDKYTQRCAPHTADHTTHSHSLTVSQPGLASCAHTRTPMHTQCQAIMHEDGI